MGTLYIVSTPIGNLDDITIRAIKTLFSVDYIACEDTRKTGQLMKNYESRIMNQELRISNSYAVSKPQFISYYDEVEEQKAVGIVNLLKMNKNVALVSNAGTPLLADPGFMLVKECVRQKIKVVPVPGPSAVLAALVASGLPANNFYFLGFLPKKKSKKRKLFEKLVNLKSLPLKPTFIAYEAPYRLKATLADMKNIFGDIEIVIARELTKIHEEIWRGKVSEAKTKFSVPKGELVLLFKI